MTTVKGQAVRYEVGDPDPTPDVGEPCEAENDGYVCTWSEDTHTGQHVAGDGWKVRFVWDGEWEE